MQYIHRWITACTLALAGSLCAPVTASASDYTKTKYPIVLAHGMLGYDSLLEINDYWHAIPDALGQSGARVFVTEVSQFNSTESRGEALLVQIEEILAITGAAKVNIIGHSQGGLDGRYVASVAPQLVASVTTVGSPHRGTEFADYLFAHLLNGSFTDTVVATFANQAGAVLGLLSGQPDNQQDSLASMYSLSSAGAAEFNAAHPAGLPSEPCGQGASVVDGIRYYSWSGTSPLTNPLDPTDALLVSIAALYVEVNDGLVGRCSSHFGTVIRDDYRQNHLDEVNQTMGLVHLFGPDPKSLFRTHANRLKNEGL